MNDAEHNPDAAPPERIFLQYHGDGSADDGPVDHGNVTWCSDRIFDSDIEYRRIDADQSARIAELTEESNSKTEAIAELTKLHGSRMREIAQLRAQVESAKAALGEHPASEADLAQRISELRDQARKPFHESTASMQEKDRLRAQMETLTKERDEARGDASFWKLRFEAAELERASAAFQRDKLLEITWLDIPDEPSESTKRWAEEFAKGWERRSA